MKKRTYWFIGIGVIAIIFFVVPLMEGKVTPYQYTRNLLSGAYSE